jgi:hypothetical protein
MFKIIIILLKIATLWDITPCGSCKNRCFAENITSIIKMTRFGEGGTTLAVTSNRSTLRSNTNTADIVPPSPILVTLMIEVIYSSETSVLTRTARRNIPEDGILLVYLLFIEDMVKAGRLCGSGPMS